MASGASAGRHVAVILATRPGSVGQGHCAFMATVARDSSRNMPGETRLDPAIGQRVVMAGLALTSHGGRMCHRTAGERSEGLGGSTGVTGIAGRHSGRNVTCETGGALGPAATVGATVATAATAWRCRIVGVILAACPVGKALCAAALVTGFARGNGRHVAGERCQTLRLGAVVAGVALASGKRESGCNVIHAGAGSPCREVGRAGMADVTACAIVRHVIRVTRRALRAAADIGARVAAAACPGNSCIIAMVFASAPILVALRIGTLVATVTARTGGQVIGKRAVSQRLGAVMATLAASSH